MNSDQFIRIEGARAHNLKDVSLDIPRNELVVITGVSGSGKSSLAFQTIYAEGQRRYLETLSSYAKQFMGGMERPEVDSITGLSPVIAIEQKTVNKNPRSTVGTITEIYDFLRLLYARAGKAYSYHTGKAMQRFTRDQIIEHCLEHLVGEKVIMLAPLVQSRKGHYRELFEGLHKKGFLKVRVDGVIVEITEGMQLDRYKVHDIEAVIDRIIIQGGEKENRVREGIDQALKMGDGLVIFHLLSEKKDLIFSQHYMCMDTGISYATPSPNTFSFNSPYGACPSCQGLGVVKHVDLKKVIPNPAKTIFEGGIVPLGSHRDVTLFRQVKRIAKRYNFKINEPIADIPEKALNVLLYGNEEGLVKESTVYSSGDKWYSLKGHGIVGMLTRCLQVTSSDGIRKWAEEFMVEEVCSSCEGFRLQKESLWFRFDNLHIGHLAQLNLHDLKTTVEKMASSMDERQFHIAEEVVKEILDRIGFMLDVGLGYLTLNRVTRSLSGGEAQRIRLATQIGSALSGVTYILDEPSIGLHQRDNERLIKSLQRLVEADNTVIVVEHDKDIMLACNHLVDIGPGAGVYGGEIVASGKPKQLKSKKTITSDYLYGRSQIAIPKERRAVDSDRMIHIKGARGNNLKNVDLSIPLGVFTCVTGVSGSGKSTLINQTLFPLTHNYVYRGKRKVMPYDSIEGLDQIDKVIDIDQSPIGRTPRSNPATYIKLFDEIRSLFAQLPESKIRGYKPGRFSFNVKGGRCETCKGAGLQTIEMNFLPDVYVECPTCRGQRYNRETLDVRYKGKSINDVLNMNVEEAVEFFEAIPNIYRKAKTLLDVGLGYLRLGQPSTTISGGEAQRVKLAAELSKRDTGQTLYILDEPTTGLHFNDIKILLHVLQNLVNKGNSVIVIEHNMDVIKVADHIIDLGPEGGEGGGQILLEGSPEYVASQTKTGHTARFLSKELEQATSGKK
ncbi:MAG: excinuclease ABC subunit UvrA [Bacteroidota bacterium]|nr:excinuclease ABC subunit UvrA [Bacteroidota bacterium]